MTGQLSDNNDDEAALLHHFDQLSNLDTHVIGLSQRERKIPRGVRRICRQNIFIICWIGKICPFNLAYKNLSSDLYQNMCWDSNWSSFGLWSHSCSETECSRVTDATKIRWNLSSRRNQCHLPGWSLGAVGSEERFITKWNGIKIIYVNERKIF